jgi:subtilisin family serine protease
MKRLSLVVAAASVAAVLVSSAGANVDEPSAAPFDQLVGVTNNSGFKPASMDGNRVVSVILELGDAPVAKREAAARAAGTSLSKAARAQIRAELKQKQQGVKEQVAALGGAVTYDYQDAYNGVAAEVAVKDLAALAAAPGVVAVHPSRVIRPENLQGGQFMNVGQAWTDYGQTGAGVVIAVIDTGVDYTHANFGGPGTEAAYTANNGTVVEAGTFPTAKVIGGTDFVGDAYDADSDDPAERVPHPDPDPLDCNGHGSHVAGSAAGYGVLSTGATYTGPYNSTTHLNSFRIGPGVAPGASILAFRVFGCGGSSATEVIVAAINAAVAAGADVINMSLGSPFGRTDEPDAVAANNAVDQGVSVIASAGNPGGGAYTTGSPGAADKVLSVAAIDANASFPGATMTLSTGKTLTAINANGAALPAGPLPIHVLRNADGSVSLGCDPAQYVAQNVTGKLVVTLRGVCARVARAIFAQKAGAAAVAMLNTSPGYPPYEGEIRVNPDTGEKFTVTIPLLGIRGCYLATGSCTAANDTTDPEDLVAADGGTATLAATTVTNPAFGTFASFTAGGYRNVDSAVKPEVTAPGVSVTSTGVGTGNKASILSGTSMAAPMTAGAAALLLGENPAWSPERVKAAIVNTANAAAFTSGYNVRRGGTGVVNVRRAIDTVGWTTTTNGRVSLSYGYDAIATPTHSETLQLTLHNGGTVPITYNLTTEFVGSPIGGGTMTVTPSTVTVAAGATATVAATLTVNAATLPAATASNFGAVQSIQGVVVATPTTAGTGIYPLRTAFALVPRGLSDVKPAALSYTRRADTFSASLTVANTGVHSGTADVYAWGIHDANDVAHPEDSMDVRDVGVKVLPREFLCGTTPAGTCGTANDRSVVFAVNVWGFWSNPSVNEIDVAIDYEGDNDPDAFVIGVDFGAVTADAFDGRFAAFTFDAEGNLVNVWVATAPMNGSTALLPALASDLGLTAPGKGDGRFRYWVNAFSIVPEGLVDTTEAASFELFEPPVPTNMSQALNPGQSHTFSPALTVRRSDLARNAVLGWLVVTLDDANGAAQADEVPIGDAAPPGRSGSNPGQPRVEPPPEEPEPTVAPTTTPNDKEKKPKKPKK